MLVFLLFFVLNFCSSVPDNTVKPDLQILLQQGHSLVRLLSPTKIKLNTAFSLICTTTSTDKHWNTSTKWYSLSKSRSLTRSFTVQNVAYLIFENVNQSKREVYVCFNKQQGIYKSVELILENELAPNLKFTSSDSKHLRKVNRRAVEIIPKQYGDNKELNDILEQVKQLKEEFGNPYSYENDREAFEGLSRLLQNNGSTNSFGNRGTSNNEKVTPKSEIAYEFNNDELQRILQIAKTNPYFKDEGEYELEQLLHLPKPDTNTFRSSEINHNVKTTFETLTTKKPDLYKFARDTNENDDPIYNFDDNYPKQNFYDNTHSYEEHKDESLPSPFSTVLYLFGVFFIIVVLVLIIRCFKTLTSDTDTTTTAGNRRHPRPNHSNIHRNRRPNTCGHTECTRNYLLNPSGVCRYQQETISSNFVDVPEIDVPLTTLGSSFIHNNALELDLPPTYLSSAHNSARSSAHNSSQNVNSTTAVDGFDSRILGAFESTSSALPPTYDEAVANEEHWAQHDNVESSNGGVDSSGGFDGGSGGDNGGGCDSGAGGDSGGGCDSGGGGGGDD